MLRKGTKLYSIFHNKCPRCQEGDFFIEKSPLKINKALKMHTHCTNCNFKYMMEPSFYYGAMYVNYALSVGIAVIVFAICTLFLGLGLMESILPILLTMIIAVPFTLKYSRIIWINIFVRYKSPATD